MTGTTQIATKYNARFYFLTELVPLLPLLWMMYVYVLGYLQPAQLSGKKYELNMPITITDRSTDRFLADCY